MADARLKLTASEIEAILLAELRKKIPDTQSVSIRPHSSPKDNSFSWKLDKIEPEPGPVQLQFANVPNIVGRLQSQYDLKRAPAKKRS